MTKFESVQEDFQNALASFEKILKEEKNDIVRDSAIKRFELVFDMAWKTIKAFLEEKGITCTSPFDCFRGAYKQGLIDYEEIWIKMIKTRNKTVHTYNLKLAEMIYEELPEALSSFQKLSASLVKQKQLG